LGRALAVIGITGRATQITRARARNQILRARIWEVDHKHREIALSLRHPGCNPLHLTNTRIPWLR
jgi:hypothetical protein